MFSGQGSQYQGMGKELYDNFEIVKETFDKADRHLGYSLTNIIFNDEAKLNETLYTQLAIYTLEASILYLLRENGVNSDATLGLSLGEYAAYLDSGVFDFTKGLDVISKRSLFMSEASKKVSGKMSAILNLDEKSILDIVNNKVDGYVSIANYNSYGQIVITGEEKAVLQANKLALDSGARRVVVLNTSGAFHSLLMKEAADDFNEYLKEETFYEPNKELLINVTGSYYVKDIKDVMRDQITNSVMFYQMIEKLIEDKIEVIIEIGPKKVLSSFVKKISRDIQLFNVEDKESFKNLIDKIKEC